MNEVLFAFLMVLIGASAGWIVSMVLIKKFKIINPLAIVGITMIVLLLLGLFFIYFDLK